MQQEQKRSLGPSSNKNETSIYRVWKYYVRSQFGTHSRRSVLDSWKFGMPFRPPSGMSSTSWEYKSRVDYNLGRMNKIITGARLDKEIHF